MTAECNRELEALIQQQNALAQPPGSCQEFDHHLAQLNAALRQAQASIETAAIGKAFVDKFISKITATPAGDAIQLEIPGFQRRSDDKIPADALQTGALRCTAAGSSGPHVQEDD